MASRIIEFFGYGPTDPSEKALAARSSHFCPFLKSECQKRLSDRTLSGVCTLKPKNSEPVICCPIRLYAEDYRILGDVAIAAFGGDCRPVLEKGVATGGSRRTHSHIAVFGKGWGKELRLPNRGKSGSYFVDWILAKLDDDGKLIEFVAVEVQSIDTTGNYQLERNTYLQNAVFNGWSTAGLNWENVNKRILPQLIYKGHVLRRERLCKSGLFFICPKPVYDKIRERLGGHLLEYIPQSGSLTFMWYDVVPSIESSILGKLQHLGQFTTTVDQIALAFTSPSNLPEANVYEAAIRAELEL